ncbi:hypothetical protein SK128_000925 [Halocaridina rubra]|uniref:Uncharacterized protein n=1 Tax=Halocaridina rubra TaxID=373956 RepID=A0AAN8X5E8_HALRR
MMCHNNKKETKKDAAKNVDLVNELTMDDQKDFAFCIYTEEYSKGIVYGKKLLVDIGATAHIIYEKEKFVTFEEYFNPKKHMID